MGLETLKSRRDTAKLKWWYKLATMPEDRFPKQLFSQEWDQNRVEVDKGKHGVE